MGAFFNLFFEDIRQQLRCNKRQLLLCCLCAVVGIVLGIALVNAVNENWWYCNRCNFVCKLVYDGFFGVFITVLCNAVVCCFLLSLLSMWRWTRFLCYPFIIVVSIYCGANCAVIVPCVGVQGVLYMVFVLLVSEIANVLCCFLTLCVSPCRRTVREAFGDLQSIVIIQSVGVLYKLLIIFLPLRLLTAAV